MDYRREIDGLRAIAVLPVIFFHTGFAGFRGGYVGVDVFFVISGYLITTIILTEMERGEFSLVNFYERRARRILPPLIFMVLCCLPFAWLWLLPNHLQDFSESLVAVSVFSSNLLFWQESGYFATANELKPLLHTWSLAVEEQYYLLFPLFLLLMWRLRKRYILASLVVIAIASLSLAHWGAARYPAATFYLLSTRMWELALGAVIAFYFLYRQHQVERIRSNRYLCECGGWLGICLIGYAASTFSHLTPFPSLYALVPTVGTALVITFASQRTFVGRMLGSKLLVGTGLISYGTYLWHQPLFAFARHRSLSLPDPRLMIGLAALSFVLAYCSWKFVEIPFRNKQRVTRKGMFCSAVATSLALVVVGGLGWAGDGWPTRVDQQTYVAIEKARSITYPRESTQYLEASGAAGADSDILFLLGDSFAGQFSAGLSEYAKSQSMSYEESFLAGCPPAPGYAMKISGVDCGQRNNKAFARIKEDKRIKVVVVVANWTGYLEKYNLFTNKFIELYSNAVVELLQTGKRIVLVYPIPIYDYDIADTILKRAFLDGKTLGTLTPESFSVSYIDFRKKNFLVYNLFDSFSGHGNLIRILPERVFCDSVVADRCVVLDSKDVFYRDNGHLSAAGANLIIAEIEHKLTQSPDSTVQPRR